MWENVVMLLQWSVSAISPQLSASMHSLHHIHNNNVTAEVVRAETRPETLTRLNPEGNGWCWKANQSCTVYHPQPCCLLLTKRVTPQWFGSARTSLPPLGKLHTSVHVVSMILFGKNECILSLAMSDPGELRNVILCSEVSCTHFSGVWFFFMRLWKL